MLRIISLISFGSLLFSCSQVQSSNEKNTNLLHSKTEINNKDTLTYTYRTFKKNSDFFIHSDDVIDSTYFYISYPAFNDEMVNGSIKHLILHDGENTAAEAAQSFIDGFDEFVGDSNIELINSGWTKDVNCRVIINSPMFISFYNQVNEYSGGAHGQHHTNYFNLDLRTKSILKWDDILKQNKFVELTKIAEKHFRNQHHLTSDASLDKDFFFQDGIFTLNDNFGLTKNALIIYYNEYEIKPYSEGPTILEIPYKDLDTVFNDRAKELIKSIN